MNVIMAVQMSTNPFSSFTFDGIFGLGLQMLAVTDDFSFIDMLSRSSNNVASQFAVFLTEGEDGEESEIALGGYNSNRALGVVSWSPVVDADEGHWLVKILAVRVDGQTLPLCQDGTCKGVVDTGTSHIGIPIAAEESVSRMLTVNAEDFLDCRLASAPTLEFELEGGNITLSAQNYMRRLPLREGVDVGAVVVSANDSVSDPVFEPQAVDEHAVNVVRHCSPRTMPVDMPEPLGPNLFILGEPVLHRYYTVYDWVKLQVGFSLANSKRNTQALPDGKGTLPEDVQLLMQHGMRGSLALDLAEPLTVLPEPTIFVQLVFRCAPGVMC
jgi:cathepsin D